MKFANSTSWAAALTLLAVVASVHTAETKAEHSLHSYRLSRLCEIVVYGGGITRDAATPASTSWQAGHSDAEKFVGAFQASAKEHPLIPMGRPYPYGPSK
jgi:hypothetical protein